MINKDVSSKILIVGTDTNGKGGMAILLNSHSKLFEVFNYVCSHRFSNILVQLFLAISAIFRVIYYCLFKDIRIVHIHSASYRSFYRESLYLLIAKLFNKKVILQLHGGEFEVFYNQNKRYCQYICHKADCLVGVSNYFENMFRRLNLNDNIVTLYNVVEKPINEKQQFDKHKSKLEILFFGAIDVNKGIFEVLDMWGENKEQMSELFHLTICGIGDSDRLNKIIYDFQLSDTVTYKGWVNIEDKNNLLAQSDIYLQPSHFESLGIAIIEALSYGIPVIASNVGGIPELITDNENGYLIPVGDMEQLKFKLIYLSHHIDLFDAFEIRAKQKASQFFSENIEKDIITLYKQYL